MKEGVNISTKCVRKKAKSEERDTCMLVDLVIGR